jgi:hypothetical protein
MLPADAGNAYSTEENPDRDSTRRTTETFVFHFPIQRFHQIKPLVIFIFLSLELGGECTAQVHESTLGVVRTLATPGEFRFLRELPNSSTGATTFLLWNDRSHDVVLGHVDSSFGSLTTERHSLRVPFDDILIADMNHDSKSEFVFLSKQERTISIVLDLSGDTLDVDQTVKLPFVPTGWKVGDINSDGNADILLFDRNNPGIVPLLGKGNGTFVIGRTIAPDLATGSIAVTHLNNDDLLDIVAFDWVKRELHLLYGVGRGRFLDQSTFQVQGDVSEILPARLDPSNNLDLVLVTRQPSEIQDWQGNGIGDFKLSKRARLDNTLVSCAFGDLNGDLWDDIGFITESPSLQILVNGGDEWLQDRLQFSAGKNPVSIVLRDFNSDGKTDALVLDQAGQMLWFYFNSAQDNTVHDSLEFAAPPYPSGIVIHKIGFGMSNDLAVVNSLGKSLSLFAYRDPGGLLGQTPFSLSINPQFLTFHSMTDSSARFVVTSSSGDSLLLLSMNFKDSSSSYAVIPSEGSVQVVQADTNGAGQVEFFTFNTFSGDQNPDIHYYERLDPGTFIEQSFHLGKPDELLGATAAFMNGDKYPDLIYVYHNADSGNVDLAVSFGDSSMSYAQRHFSVEIPGMSAAPSYLWCTSFSHPDTLDLLLYFGAPSYTLEEARGKGNGQFEQPIVLLRDVRLTNRSMLQIVDSDRDGIPDIVLSNANGGSLGWLRGTEGGFKPWQELLRADVGEFFAVGDLNGDGIADIALSRSARGTIVIYNGSLLFKKGDNGNSR